MSEPESETEGETITIHELLERSARAALDLQREDGSFPPGRNGVYDEPETPVRTTSHWLTTLSKVYEITDDEEFAEAANDAADYLLSEEARPHGYTFHSRNAEGKDKCDGLVGQAAPIRGLVRGGIALNRFELIETAEEVFSLHPFCKRLGLWGRVEIDGERLSIDRTLNHQLTFAAASAELAECGIDTLSIERFLDRLDKTMRLHPSGLIKHYLRPPLSDTLWTVISSPEHWNLVLNEAAFHYYSRSTARQKKELGYHPTNLRNLARLNESFPSHSVWGAETVGDAISFANSETYSGQEGVMNITYGSMTPGMHTAYTLLVFGDSDRTEISSWLARDVKQLFDFERNLLVKNSRDRYFQAATIYNAVFLPNTTVNLRK